MIDCLCASRGVPGMISGIGFGRYRELADLPDEMVSHRVRSFITLFSSNAVSTSPAKTLRNRAFSEAKSVGVAPLTQRESCVCHSYKS